MDKSLRPHIALLACNVIWALDYPFYKIVMPQYISPLAMATSAVVIAALLSLATLPFSPWEKVDKKDIPKLLGAALLITALRKIFLMEGVAHTSPVDGSVIGTLIPIFVLILSVIIGIDKFTPKRIIGVLFAAGGAAAVILMGSSSSHPSSTLYGNLFVLLCVFFTAFYMVWVKKLLLKYKTMTVLRWIYCAGALMMLPFGAPAIVHTDYAAFTHPVLWAYLFVLLLPTFLPNLLQAYGLKYVKPMVSSMYAYIGPIIATAVSLWMGQDKLRWDTVLAAMAIFFGIYLVIRSYRPPIPAIHMDH